MISGGKNYLKYWISRRGVHWSTWPGFKRLSFSCILIEMWIVTCSFFLPKQVAKSVGERRVYSLSSSFTWSGTSVREETERAPQSFTPECCSLVASQLLHPPKIWMLQLLPKKKVRKGCFSKIYPFTEPSSPMQYNTLRFGKACISLGISGAGWSKHFPS